MAKSFGSEVKEKQSDLQLYFVGNIKVIDDLIQFGKLFSHTLSSQSDSPDLYQYISINTRLSTLRREPARIYKNRHMYAILRNL